MARLVLVVAVLGACKFSAQPATNGEIDAPAGTSDAPPIDASEIDAPVAPVDAPPDAPPQVTVRRDCLAWKQAGVATDGPQMIDPDETGANAPFTAYCDMTTAGGGWTLVWVYGFTNYAMFNSGNNAVTPRPTWGVPATGTPTSTTIPTSPSTPGALTFSSWSSLGAEFLVMSNINHVVRCQPGTGGGGGSLVAFTKGPITCQLVQDVATACLTTVPSYFNNTDTSGVGLYTSNNLLATYYFWEGLTNTSNWPTHDPCGMNGQRQVTGVANPYGAIYLRRP